MCMCTHMVTRTLTHLSTISQPPRFAAQDSLWCCVSLFFCTCDLCYIKIKALIQHPKDVLVSWVKIAKQCVQKESFKY